MKRLEVLLIVSLFGVFPLLHSFWEYGDGGWSWGPRFLVPAIPSLMAMTALLEGKAVRALLALALVGFLVSVPTLVSCYDRYYEESCAHQVSAADRRWVPAQAPALLMWGAAGRVLAEMRRQNATQPVAIWWSVPPVFSIPLWLDGVCSLATCFLAWRIMPLAPLRHQEPKAPPT